MNYCIGSQVKLERRELDL